MNMPERGFLAYEHRFGFNGMEQDDEVKGAGNSLNFGARIYDSRIGRWLSVDPLENKFTGFSPFSINMNNPLLIIDPDGRDTLLIHAKILSSENHPELGHPETKETVTVAFEISFSLVKRGVEFPLRPTLSGGENTFYFATPKYYYKGGNVWYNEGVDELTPIRFESYIGLSGAIYKNAIRLWYPRGPESSVRNLAHKMGDTGGSLGCCMPTVSLKQADYLGDYVTLSEGSQEVLDMIRNLYDENIESREIINHWGRTVQEPEEGFDFMIKTNSSSPKTVDYSRIKSVSPDLIEQPPDLTPTIDLRLD